MQGSMDQQLPPEGVAGSRNKTRHRRPPFPITYLSMPRSSEDQTNSLEGGLSRYCSNADLLLHFMYASSAVITLCR